MMSLRGSGNVVLARRSTWWWCGLALACGLGVVACAEGDDNPMPATGGTAGSGGGAGSGAGGSAGSAGTSGTGGASGGSAGTSGSAGGGSTTPTTVYDFNDSLEGFVINYYCLGPATGANCTQVMAAPPPAAADAGVDGGDAAVAPAPPQANDFFDVTQDPAVGDPDVGSAKIELNFTSGEQKINFAVNPTAVVNLTGKIATARIRAGVGAPAVLVAKMYVKSGTTYTYADSGEVTLTPGTWQTLSFNAGVPPSYVADATLFTVADIREIGFDVTARGVTAATPTVVHIDTVQY